MNYHQSDPWHGDPSHQSEARNYMLGLNKFGEIIDPCTWQYGEVFGGINCSEVNPYFIYSGDPTSNVGWINTMHTNQKTILNTGPFTLRENESVYIIAAYIVGRGNNPLSSIPAASEIATFVQQFYQSNFDENLVDVNDDMELVINDYVLYQNYPNPFNPFTKISYQIPQQGFVTLKIFDVLGKEVATLVNEEKPAGRYEVNFSSKGIASGVYIYRMKVNDFIESKKMILLR